MQIMKLRRMDTGIDLRWCFIVLPIDGAFSKLNIYMKYHKKCRTITKTTSGKCINILQNQNKYILI